VRILAGNFAEVTTSTPFRDLSHAVNLRHGTEGFTSPPKEGVLRIFFALKNPTASAGCVYTYLFIYFCFFVYLFCLFI
jgi:hypothetical protein